jgi:hypothetical protein
MSYKKQPIGIVLVTAIASLLLAASILAPTEASALSKFNTNTDTSNLKHGIRDGVSVNLEHRDQHMNQENLCYRTNTCRQANDGQNTLGNDNSVTGFADQSDNLKQSASAPVTPSTTNQTTANKTSPTPTPTTATLTVSKHVRCNFTSGCPAASQFAITASTNSGSSIPLIGLESGTSLIFIPPFPVIYKVTENNPQAGVVIATIPVGTRPVSIAFNPNNGNMYVTNNDDNSVSVIFQ